MVQIGISLSARPINRLLRPNPSLNTDVPHAWAAPAVTGRRLAPFR
jgi:hypothetical protein